MICRNCGERDRSVVSTTLLTYICDLLAAVVLGMFIGHNLLK